MSPKTVLILLASSALLGGCPEGALERRAIAFEGPTMGTAYKVKVARTELSEERRREIDTAIRAELELVNSLMSTYLDDSELSRLNQHETTEPFVVSAATHEVLRTALELSRTTGGAYDVTVGPLVNAWGFGPGSSHADRPPPEMSDEEVAALRERIGWQKLELAADSPDAGNSPAVVKRQVDLYCDLSSLAKGYAVDRVAEALLALGEEDFMVEVGGEVRARGKNDRGQVWRIGIERPQLLRGAIQRIVALDGLALATSGDYRNYRELDGERFSHIMDPRSGRPIRHRLASVSVVDPRCMTADAWATALLVLGENEGFELAVRENLAALFLVRDADGFRELATPAFEELLP